MKNSNRCLKDELYWSYSGLIGLGYKLVGDSLTLKVHYTRRESIITYNIRKGQVLVKIIETDRETEESYV